MAEKNVSVAVREVLILLLICSGCVNVYLYHAIYEQQDPLGSNENGLPTGRRVTGRFEKNKVANMKPKGEVPHQKLNQLLSLASKQQQKNDTRTSGLYCGNLVGGPFKREHLDDIQYWKSHESHEFESVYQEDSGTNNNEDKYLVFQPDEAGFSNVRMSFETVVALAKATNRVLVLPPRARFSQLLKGKSVKSYWFTDFFDLSHLRTISFRDYLENVAMKGRLKSFPPGKMTAWDDRTGNSANCGTGDRDLLYGWLATAMTNITWNRDQCIIGFPNQNRNTTELQNVLDTILRDDAEKKKKLDKPLLYSGKPIPVDSSTRDRLEEMQGRRTQLCFYDSALEDAQSIYMTGLEKTGSRPLIQFYAYFFFQDWKQDLQMKRFIRDHVRYADGIQCAAARIVQAIRARSREAGDATGSFDTMHVRRKDFKLLAGYKDGLDGADKIVSDQYITQNRTLYISTDEDDKNFFAPMRKHYNLLFLGDFTDLLKSVDPNYYGMIEQLVCARGDKFVGTFYSTFTAYINRVRGYHARKLNLPGSKEGIINSEYLGHSGNYRHVMQKYEAVRNSFWNREWPTAVRDAPRRVNFFRCLHAFLFPIGVFILHFVLCLNGQWRDIDYKGATKK